MSSRKLNELKVAREFLERDLVDEAEREERESASHEARERGELLLCIIDVLIQSPHLEREDAWVSLRELLVNHIVADELFDEVVGL